MTQTVVKRISVVRRRPDLSRAQFEAHWLGPHVEIIRTIPNVLGYVINLIDGPGPDGWDGIAEIWFPSRQEALDAFETEPVRSLLAADRQQFLDDVQVFFVEERQIIAVDRVLAKGN